MTTVVLVEGLSDQAAVLALAERRGRDLAADDVRVVAIGGATNVRRALSTFGAVPVAGLCDAREAAAFGRALEAADGTSLGCFVCDADLEDELIRALGPDAVEAILVAEGELRAFRTFQRQPAQLGRPIDAQLRRFIGTKSGRKIRYGRLLVEALDLDRVPRPLEALLNRV